MRVEREDAVLDEVTCGRGRSYKMFQPPGISRWGCYFEDSDGRRYPCSEGTDDPPPELKAWCAERQRISTSESQ
jgi:hypothetical protein